MRDLRRIRHYLTDEVAVLVTNALVSSHLDNCNSLFRSLSSFNMRKLQCIQNTLGRIVTNYNRYSQATPILKKLHWLPVEFWCIFKTATLVYNFLHSGYPSSFSPHLSIHCGRYGTIYNHPDKMFLNTTHQYTTPKNTSVIVLLLMVPHFGMICLMMSILFQILSFSGKS